MSESAPNDSILPETTVPTVNSIDETLQPMIVGFIPYENNISRDIEFESLRIRGNSVPVVPVAPAFNVEGDSNFDGNVRINGTLEVNGDLIVRGRIIQENLETSKQKEVIINTENNKTVSEKFDRFREIRRRA